MKKTLSIILSLIMIIAALPLTAITSFAEQSGDWYYYYDEDGGKMYINEYVGTDSNVVIPSTLEGHTVTNIANNAFDGTEVDIVSITIPASVEYIHPYAFDNVKALTAINVAAENEDYCSVDGVLYNKNMTEILRCPEGKSGSFTIPTGVEIIGDSVFFECSKITAVTIPNGVYIIDEYAFAGSEISSIVMPNTVWGIGADAFEGCHSLRNVVLSNNIVEIDDYAFYSCPRLESVTIPDSVLVIGRGALGYPKYECYGTEPFTIKGYTNSEAHDYALANEIAFSSIGQSSYKGFPDVQVGEWYSSPIRFNVRLGLFKGNENGTFGPANNIQRQDFVLVIARYADADLSAYAGKNGGFSDVPADSYYAAAVAWAVDNGIITGYGGTNRFGTGDPITREQVCAIFYRFFDNYVGAYVGVYDVDGWIEYLNDGAQVSDWARTSVAWAYSRGVVSGSNGNFRPAGNANRAEIAKIFMNVEVNGIDYGVAM